MCAMLNGVPAGNPRRLTTKVTFAEVTLPAASLVTSKVMVAVPLPVDSALVTGGTSFDGFRSAVKIDLSASGLVGVLFEQLHDAIATTAANTARRLIVIPPSRCQ